MLKFFQSFLSHCPPIPQRHLKSDLSCLSVTTSLVFCQFRKCHPFLAWCPTPLTFASSCVARHSQWETKIDKLSFPHWRAPTISYVILRINRGEKLHSSGKLSPRGQAKYCLNAFLPMHSDFSRWEDNSLIPTQALSLTKCLLHIIQNSFIAVLTLMGLEEIQFVKINVFLRGGSRHSKCV